MPTCDPNTVTIVEPVAAALPIFALLGPGASIVSDIVSEFTCHPVEIDTRRCVQMPAALFARTELADVQTVRCAVLPPNREGMLESAIPTCVPNTVTLAEPVDATLLVIALLGAPAEYVSDTVNEFTCQPVVNATRRVVPAPVAALARTELADVHTVRGLVLPPTRDGLL